MRKRVGLFRRFGEILSATDYIGATPLRPDTEMIA